MIISENSGEKNWLSSVQEFADLETQERRWLDIAEPSPHFCFVEYVASYFDGLGLSEHKGNSIEAFLADVSDPGPYTFSSALKRGDICIQEVEATAKFHRLIVSYEVPENDTGYTSDEEILSDPKWIKVVNAAQSAQGNLLSIISDPKERQILINGDC